VLIVESGLDGSRRRASWRPRSLSRGRYRNKRRYRSESSDEYGGYVPRKRQEAPREGAAPVSNNAIQCRARPEMLDLFAFAFKCHSALIYVRIISMFIWVFVRFFAFGFVVLAGLAVDKLWRSAVECTCK
jgi:hypothetical protein